METAKYEFLNIQIEKLKCFICWGRDFVHFHKFFFVPLSQDTSTDKAFFYVPT